MSQALILAAGTGSRLRVGSPKCLVEVGGRPLLDHQLDAIEQAGVDHVTMVLGYQHERIEDVADGRAEVVLNEHYSNTNSLYSFWLARGAVERDVLLLNSDVLFAPTLLRDLMALGGSAIAYDSSSGDEEEQMKVRERRGRLAQLSKGLSPLDSDGESLGVAHLSPPTARAAFTAAGSLLGRGLVEDWAAAAINEVAPTYPISCMDVTGQPWVEIDYREDLDLARSHTWPAIAALSREDPSEARPQPISAELENMREVAI